MTIIVYYVRDTDRLVDRLVREYEIDRVESIRSTGKYLEVWHGGAFTAFNMERVRGIERVDE